MLGGKRLGGLYRLMGNHVEKATQAQAGDINTLPPAPALRGLRFSACFL